jgi:hypothetical protein
MCIMETMSSFQKFKQIERRIRTSMVYNDWVTRNKATKCVTCDKTERLHCHHVASLYAFIKGAWDLYGNEEQTVIHVLNLHKDDMIDSITLCNDCHEKLHPAGHLVEHINASINITNWTCFPRNIKYKLLHWKLEKEHIGSLGLVSFQILLGLGWHILNGRPEARMININRRHFAKLLGKAPGTSFNKSFDKAMYELYPDVVYAHHIVGNNVEIHLSQNYLDALLQNPWFIPVDDIKANKMSVLALKWFLNFQSNRQCYIISLKKLINHLNIRTNCIKRVINTITKACKEILWANVDIKDSEIGILTCTFKLTKRGATPINSLRQILADSINYGK